jgi:hypothetical protein
VGGIARLIVRDLLDVLAAEDRNYFREGPGIGADRPRRVLPFKGDITQICKYVCFKRGNRTQITTCSARLIRVKANQP